MPHYVDAKELCIVGYDEWEAPQRPGKFFTGMNVIGQSYNFTEYDKYFNTLCGAVNYAWDMRERIDLTLEEYLQLCKLYKEHCEEINGLH